MLMLEIEQNNNANPFAAQIREIHSLIARHGLDWEDICFLLSNYFDQNNKKNYEDILKAGKTIIIENAIPENQNAFKDFCLCLNEIFNVDIDISVFTSRLNKGKKGLWEFILGIMALFVTYNVIGGLILGHSSFVKNPFLSILILVLLVITLAFFEGLQISITTLRLKSLGSKSSKFPTAFALHKKIKKDDDSKKFLAGRQLVVIILVFLAAQLTSFPDLNTIPFTNLQLPYWFVYLFLKLGVFGALLVLWTGQLFPQFLANKYPSWFMNLYPNNFTLSISFFFERIGMAKPADWFAKLADKLPFLNKSDEDLPISNEEKYRQEVEDVKGYGLVSHKKIWEIKKNEINLSYQGTYAFYQNNFSVVQDDNLIISNAAIKWTNSDKIIRRSNKNANLEFSDLPANEEVLHLETDTEPIPISGSNKFKKFKTVLRPRIGDFKKGDVLVHMQNAKFNTTDSESIDQIYISRPTKFIVFRIRIYDNPHFIDKLRVTIKNKDKTITQEDPRISKTINIDMEKDNQDYWFAKFIKFYPQVNSLYEFRWRVQYRQ